MSHNLSIINFCRVRNKQAELEAFLVTHNINILLGTESHLDGSISNSELFPSQYHIYRKDGDIHGGGVFILVNSSIPSSQVVIDTPCEAVWIQMHNTQHSDIIVGSFYCPPHSPTSVWDKLS